MGQERDAQSAGLITDVSQRSAVTSVPTSTTPDTVPLHFNIPAPNIPAHRQTTGIVGNEILLKLSLVRVSITLVHVVDFHAGGLTTVTAILGPSFPSLSSSAIPTPTLHMFSLATSYHALTRLKAHCSLRALF